jgi:serine/threonine-protein kinase
MELVEGDSLRQCFRRSRPMDGAMKIARQVLAALGAAHRTGVIHRDLKPHDPPICINRDARLAWTVTSAVCPATASAVFSRISLKPRSASTSMTTICA